MRKKLFKYVLVPVMALSLVLAIGTYFSSSAYNDGDFQVNGAELVHYNGAESIVSVPDGIEIIGREAFSGNHQVESIILPESVKTISYGAFMNCDSLKEIAIPDSVTAIEDSAFSHCISLEKVSIGKGLNRIGSGVFADCFKLANINIDSANPNFSCVDGVLYQNNQRKVCQFLCGNGRYQYRMPDTVTEIDRYAFWGCDKLEDVTISTALSNVSEYAFANATGLETVTMNVPLTTIGLKAFEGCNSLKQIILPMSVTQIHDTSFDYVPQELLFICDENSYGQRYALEHGFETSTVPRYQVSYFVENSNGATGETGGNSDAEINSQTNAGNDTNVNSADVSLNGVTPTPGYESNSAPVEGDLLGNSTIVSDRVFVMVGNMVVTDGSTLNGNGSNIILSATNDYAYYNQNDLTEYDFSASPVEVIGQLSFARTGLSSVVLPEGVRTISYGAFYHCDNLREVSIPSTVTNVEAYAFEYTPWLEDWRNSSDISDFLVVGDGVLISYKGTGSNIIIPDNVKYIAAGVFRNHSELTSVTFPMGLLSIGSYAFAECENLTDMNNLSESVYCDPTAFDE